MSDTKPSTITFKTKIRTMLDSDNKPLEYIEYKRKVSRANCNLRPHEHSYYNSDLFPSMLQRAYDKAIGNREWIALDKLPANVKLDRAFLSTVTVEIMI
jgi:hypothetical protein